MGGYGEKAEIDLKGLDMGGGQDLMGLIDALRIWTMLWF